MANKKQKVIMKFKDDSFVQHLLSAVMKAGQVKIGKLGIFEVRAIPERESYSIKDGGRIVIPAYKKLVFRPSATVKKLIQDYDAGEEY